MQFLAVPFHPEVQFSKLRRALEEQSFSTFEIIVYHLGPVKLALVASLGAFLHTIILAPFH